MKQVENFKKYASMAAASGRRESVLEYTVDDGMVIET